MRAKHPGLRLHLSVQAAAATPEAIGFYAETFGIRRVVLPRVLTVEEIAGLSRGIMSRPKSSYSAACARWPKAAARCPLTRPAVAQHGGRLLAAEQLPIPSDRGTIGASSAASPSTASNGEAAGYPTLCKGRFVAGGKTALSVRRPGQPQRAGFDREPGRGRRHRAEDRRAPARPRLCGRGGADFPQRGGHHRGRAAAARSRSARCRRSSKAARQHPAPIRKLEVGMRSSSPQGDSANNPRSSSRRAVALTKSP